MGMSAAPRSAIPRLCAFALALLAVLLFLGASSAQTKAETAAPASDHPPTRSIEVFVRHGCPHCEAAQPFIQSLPRRYPGIELSVRDVRDDPAALQRLQQLGQAQGMGAPGVPSFYAGGRLIVGYDDEATTGAQILALLDGSGQPARSASGDTSCAVAATSACRIEPDERIHIPGTTLSFSAEQLGLPLFTVAIGLLDGFNPCSMWVLILMISMLAALGDRRKMALIVGTFVLIEGVAYFAFMAAWLNLFVLIGLSRTSEIVLAAVAIGAGLVNLKDFGFLGRGFSLSIPASVKPGIYARLRRILHEQHLGIALAGTVVLAVLVQVVELLCTSGFPALYTRLLTLRQLPPLSYYGYLMLYDVFYMLDDLIVLGIGLATLSQHRLQKNEGRWLKLLSGLVMVGLGVYLLFWPH